jgi:hypothetical protein
MGIWTKSAVLAQTDDGPQIIYKNYYNYEEILIICISENNLLKLIFKFVPQSYRSSKQLFVNAAVMPQNYFP